MTQNNIFLLNTEGEVINIIVVDENTPSDFLSSIIASTEEPFQDAVEAVTASKTDKASIGWKRVSGKFIAPPTPLVVEETDVVAEVVADTRLDTLSDPQKVLLEEVLSERIGRPTPRPDEV